jgi:hypothetical protein
LEYNFLNAEGQLRFFQQDPSFLRRLGFEEGLDDGKHGVHELAVDKHIDEDVEDGRIVQKHIDFVRQEVS